MKIWQVDSFATKAFKGNPAAVVLCEQPLSAEVMQNIGAEMNQSETAFITLTDGAPQLRWFTPKVEVDLCGHATLAAAHIYLTEINPRVQEVTFDTLFVGRLTVSKNGDKYTMNFPARSGERVELSAIPNFVFDALNPVKPVEAYMARDLMLVYEDEKIVREIVPNFAKLGELKKWVAVTSRSSNYDFISRFFCAGDGIDEDPVTGSAHCTLTPYWARMLGKNNLRAYQASARGGELEVELRGDRVFISGCAVTVLRGEIFV